MSWTFFFHYARCQKRERHRMHGKGEGPSSLCNRYLEGSKYPSAVLIIPQPQLNDLGCKAVGLFFRVSWGHSSKDQDALAYGGNQLLLYRDRCGEHSLEYGCE